MLLRTSREGVPRRPMMCVCCTRHGPLQRHAGARRPNEGHARSRSPIARRKFSISTSVFFTSDEYTSLPTMGQKGTCMAPGRGGGDTGADMRECSAALRGRAAGGGCNWACARRAAARALPEGRRSAVRQQVGRSRRPRPRCTPMRSSRGARVPRARQPRGGAVASLRPVALQHRPRRAPGWGGLYAPSAGAVEG